MADAKTGAKIVENLNCHKFQELIVSPLSIGVRIKDHKAKGFASGSYGKLNKKLVQATQRRGCPMGRL